MRIAIWSLALLVSGSLWSAALGQTPSVGSSDTATADPPVKRPATKPITVGLFHDLTFRDFTPKPFRFQPPAGNTRHWAKVILVLDFSVTPGRQFDRTARLAIGRTNLYFGTTMEPSRADGPTWHIERDVTDYSSLFRMSQPGGVNLGNIVNETYTGVIHGSAKLLFYPASKTMPAPETPDLVLPIPNTADGSGSVSSSTDTLSATYTFPRNITYAYLDLVTESQGQDEFWYLGVPTPLADKLQTFGNTGFREAQITLDAKPAGVAPVYPWIYTGGIDPSLWRPIPGLQTLNFVPYRVDLTPFAGVLNDGKPHKIGIRVFNAGSSFQIAAALLLYRDPRLSIVEGSVTENTLTADPRPDILHSIKTLGDQVSGPVTIQSRRRFRITGWVQTSHGKVETQIAQEITFSSRQQFELSPTQTSQKIDQETTVAATMTTRTGAQASEQRRTFRYPLTFLSLRQVQPDKTSAQTTTVHQGYHTTETLIRNHTLIFADTLSNEVSPSDTLLFDASGKFTGHRDWKSAQTYAYSDSKGQRYRRTGCGEEWEGCPVHPNKTLNGGAAPPS